MATRKTLETIKQLIKENVGKDIKLKKDKGRKRYVEYEGVLIRTYPSVFVVEISYGDKIRKATYSYTDVLTGRVIVSLAENDQLIGIITE